MFDELRLLIEGLGLLAIIGGVWKVAHIAAAVDAIKTNDMPHIYEEMVRMNGRIDELHKLL